MGRSRGSGDRESGLPAPPEKSQNARFPSSTAPDPLKVTKLPSHVGSSSAHQRNAGRAHVGPLFWILSPLINLQKCCQSGTHSHKTFWIRTRLGVVSLFHTIRSLMSVHCTHALNKTNEIYVRIIYMCTCFLVHSFLCCFTNIFLRSS